MPRKLKAPPIPVEAPTMPQDRPEPPEATQAAPVPPWPGREHAKGEKNPQKARLVHGKRSMENRGSKNRDRTPPETIAVPAPTLAGMLAPPPDSLCYSTVSQLSRARWPASIGSPGWPWVLAELRRAMPWDVACRLHGVAPDSALNALLELPEAAAEVQTAKAQGEAYLLADTRLDPRERQWRLERLYPKRYHLPTKVTGVPEEEGGTPIGHRVTLELSDARDLARGRVIDATARVLDTSAAPQIPAENDTSPRDEYRPDVSRSAESVTKRTG